MPEFEWVVRYSAQYIDQLNERQYRHRVPEIGRRIQKVLVDPYRAAKSERLKYDYSGLRSAVIHAGIRVIYRICEECRQLSEGNNRWRLDCCESAHTPDRCINILCLSEHYADMPVEFDFEE